MVLADRFTNGAGNDDRNKGQAKKRDVEGDIKRRECNRSSHGISQCKRPDVAEGTEDSGGHGGEQSGQQGLGGILGETVTGGLTECVADAVLGTAFVLKDTLSGQSKQRDQNDGEITHPPQGDSVVTSIQPTGRNEILIFGENGEPVAITQQAFVLK